jgi:DUF2934 family protein
VEPLQTKPEHHQTIQLAAYHFWQERGSPFGSPEVDWHRAEEQLGKHLEDSPTNPIVVTVAAAVGSALGSVAGLVSSVAGLDHTEEDSGSR